MANTTDENTDETPTQESTFHSEPMPFRPSENTLAHGECKVMITLVGQSFRPTSLSPDLTEMVDFSEVSTFGKALQTVMNTEALVLGARYRFGTCLPEDLIGIVVTSYTATGQSVQRRHNYFPIRYEGVDLDLWEGMELHPGRKGAVVGHLAFHVQTHVFSDSAWEEAANRPIEVQVDLISEGNLSSGDLLSESTNM